MFYSTYEIIFKKLFLETNKLMKTSLVFGYQFIKLTLTYLVYQHQLLLLLVYQHNPYVFLFIGEQADKTV